MISKSRVVIGDPQVDPAAPDPRPSLRRKPASTARQRRPSTEALSLRIAHAALTGFALLRTFVRTASHCLLSGRPQANDASPVVSPWPLRAVRAICWHGPLEVAIWQSFVVGCEAKERTLSTEQTPPGEASGGAPVVKLSGFPHSLSGATLSLRRSSSADI